MRSLEPSMKEDDHVAVEKDFFDWNPVLSRSGVDSPCGGIDFSSCQPICPTTLFSQFVWSLSSRERVGSLDSMRPWASMVDICGRPLRNPFPELTDLRQHTCFRSICQSVQSFLKCECLCSSATLLGAQIRFGLECLRQCRLHSTLDRSCLGRGA